jgi:branched-subunit amino acid aminotransferase/4-amino-4-deoxychorismate lyase
MHPFCFFDNKIVKVNKVGLKLNDLGVLRAAAVFEFSRTYDGKPFLFHEHFKRFITSAKLAGIPFNKKESEVLKIVLKLIKLNKHKNVNIRFVLTGGVSKKGLEIERPLFYILIEKQNLLNPIVYKKGGKLITVEHLRQLSRAKTTNYLVAVKNQKIKKEKGAVEILYTYKGKILEASTSNFFAIIGNNIITPKKNILFGTTRNFIIKIAKDKFKIKEKDLFVKDIKKFDEAFITATNKEIVPIVKIDNLKIGNSKPGIKTKKLIEFFKKNIKPFLI